MSNRKRTSSRNVQTIRCADFIVKDGKKIKNPKAGILKQIRHPAVFPETDTKLSDPRAKDKTPYNMSVSYVGEGELEGIIQNEWFEVIVHATNRATLVRKARRQLHEKHGIAFPVVNIPSPSQRIEGVVV